MYSDEDSDSSHSIIKSYSRYISKPYLHLYDEDEARAREHAAWRRRDTKDKPHEPFSLPFSTHVVRHLSELRALHTLTVRDCLVTENVLSGSELDGIELPVYNLCLRFTSETTNMWHILPLCPSLRTLSIFSPFRFDVPVPSDEVWTRCRFFPHLERLTLTHIHSSSLNDLAFALLSVALVSELHITHFKLHTMYGVRDAEILFLLRAIQNAPIEVLVLEGLAEAEPALFSRIGECFESTLVALTLIRRASIRQVGDREITWPRPTWKYAPHLSRLTKLQHFDWNSFCPFTTVPSSSLLDFENGFLEILTDMTEKMKAMVTLSA
ncbi:hypothetical protein BDZ94DRAFT_1310219 [Collybia nuda]|uniref:Uncharacterized protein n=1 Tax=Collybia nuda TaxID=64659 RepID=A0A9P5Y1V2_9AGAR|nr:hypothetical protein BDZ94DRAFT_1310219 [Collybia nuda]